MDTLRGFTIFLVVIYHVTLIYTEFTPVQKYLILLDPVPETYKGLFMGILTLTSGPLLNSLMFFIAGFFAFGAYQRKGGLLFFKDKIKKLGIPYLGGLITLAPLTLYIANRSWGKDDSFPRFWLKEFFLPRTINPQHLWFIGVLLIFFIISIPVFGFLRKRKQETRHKRCTQKIMIIFFLLITFLFYFGLNFRYRTYTFISIYIIKFPPVLLPLYAAYFALGVYASFQKWFSGGRKEYIYPWAVTYTLSLILYMGIFVIIPTSMEANNPLMALAYTVSIFSGIMLMIAVFKRYANKETKFIAWFSRNSYGAYLLHYLIVFGLVYLTRTISLPVMVKYIAQCVFCPCLAWVLAGLLKSYTPLRRIL
jgi:hypothetical protein